MQLYIITGTQPNTPFDFIIKPFCTAKHVHKEAKRYFFQQINNVKYPRLNENKWKKYGLFLIFCTLAVQIIMS